MRRILIAVALLHGSSIWATESVTLEQSSLTACALSEFPWAYPDERDAPAGIAMDLHGYFQRTTGREIHTKPCTVGSAATFLKEGSVDLALLPQAEGLSQWAEPLILAYRAREMVLPRKGVVVHNYEDLYSLTIATADGIDFDSPLRTDPRIARLSAKSADEALGLLVAQRVDAVVGNANVYRFAASRRGIDPNELFGPPFLLAERIVWVYISRKTDAPEFTAKLRAAFDDVSLENMIMQLRDGYYQRAISRH